MLSAPAALREFDVWAASSCSTTDYQNHHVRSFLSVPITSNSQCTHAVDSYYQQSPMYSFLYVPVLSTPVSIKGHLVSLKGQLGGGAGIEPDMDIFM